MRANRRYVLPDAVIVTAKTLASGDACSSSECATDLLIVMRRLR